MVTKRFLIRCDSSDIIGSGHVMRCLSLAEKLRSSGNPVEFASRDLPYNINNAIEKKQFKLNRLSGQDYDEFSEIKHLLGSERYDCVIVDHYALGLEWEQMINSMKLKLMVIDDIFRPHNCTYLLDQNYHVNHSKNWEEKANVQKLFLGPEYALLSDDFLKLIPRLRSGPVKNILVFFGGSDLAEGSEMFLEAWTKIKMNNVHAKLVIGNGNPRKDSLLKIQSKNLEIVMASHEFATWLSNSDLFVGAGGTTTWERCYLGVPSIVISIADNQTQIARNLHDEKKQYFLGDISTINSETLVEALRSIIPDDSTRAEFSKNCLNLKVSSKLSQLIEVLKN